MSGVLVQACCAEPWPLAVLTAPPSDPPSPITLAAVESVFLERPSFDSTLPMMLRVLASRSSPAITQVSVDAVESVMRQETVPGWVNQMMNLLEARLGVEVPKAMYTAPRKNGGSWVENLLDEMKQRPEEQRAHWELLKTRAKLTPKPLADFQIAPKSRSGGETPL